MKPEAQHLKKLKKVDDTSQTQKKNKGNPNKPIAKPKAKRQSKKTLKLLPGQVSAILFSKSLPLSPISERAKIRASNFYAWMKNLWDGLNNFQIN